jgi:hypothetical protein
MKKLPVITLGLALLLTTVITAWWLASSGSRMAVPLEITLRAKGPQDPAFCAPPLTPRPPPPVDSPFGVHLFATTALGVVHPLPAMEISSQLAPPPKGQGLAPASPTPGRTPVPTPALTPASSTAGLTPAPTPTPGPGPSGRAYNETGLDDVQSVVMLLEEFRRAFGAMPTGELNDEVVRRLQGENPKGLAVLPKTHPNLNAQGELLDRWGTPYRFHPESAWETTVRSAGPDKTMWTSDDILSAADNPQTVTAQF